MPDTKIEQENRPRKRRKVSTSEEKPREAERKRDQAASEKMVDEGDPNPAPVKDV